MFQVYTCMTVDHDWRLVVLAGVICFLASAVAISLFHHAQATVGRAHIVWLSLMGVLHADDIPDFILRKWVLTVAI